MPCALPRQVSPTPPVRARPQASVALPTPDTISPASGVCKFLVRAPASRPLPVTGGGCLRLVALPRPRREQPPARYFDEIIMSGADGNPALGGARGGEAGRDRRPRFRGSGASANDEAAPSAPPTEHGGAAVASRSTRNPRRRGLEGASGGGGVGGGGGGVASRGELRLSLKERLDK